ncbi:GNAT family N-acetyltransferase [Reichenbachiella agarivorans]|uniref:GNAT family N-acetyltransferase n=1 Tax=Reichenbachiella agarivorans TaxID=2979464 RepID=A0ABY6CSS8_9BACT|nr:GNAT family N-acetyltransferase [Reichenbachiella agarivorans]UXP33579.1 GNAT family N-acetyltransferase [Reichenbachiella agarivorans]
MSDDYHIRKGVEADLPTVLELIKELAIYERALHEVSNTIEMMKRDGFGEEPVFGFLVAVSSETGRIVGLSLYYYRYSTWKGKRLYLEDLIVTESERGKGVGKLLMDHTIEFGKSQNCTGMMWQALDWNEPALNFYKLYGATFDSEWVNCHLDFA